MKYYCKVPLVFTYIMLIYLIASVYYMIVTRNLGTPYSDAIKEVVENSGKKDELEKLKKDAKDKRSTIFWSGVLIACIILIIFRPFSECGNPSLVNQVKGIFEDIAFPIIE